MRSWTTTCRSDEGDVPAGAQQPARALGSAACLAGLLARAQGWRRQLHAGIVFFGGLCSAFWRLLQSAQCRVVRKEQLRRVQDQWRSRVHPQRRRQVGSWSGSSWCARNGAGGRT